jgi:hypothetical protein
MMHPTAPFDVELGDLDLGIVAACGTLGQSVNTLGQVALAERQPWLVGNFVDNVSTQCRGLILLRPVGEEIHVCMVEPCLLEVGTRMILVSADRAQAFEMNAACQLVERPVPPPAKVKKGIERAWADLVQRMRSAITPTGEYRFKSRAVYLPPEIANQL